MKPDPRHILVADDLPDNRWLLVQWLERQGYRVSQAGNGEEALAVVKADRPDLMLLDLMMPTLDGFGVLERLQGDEGPFLPVVVVTAATEREARVRALGLGAHEVLNKPVDIEEVTIRVRTLLRLKDANDELARLNAALRDENRQIEAVVAERTEALQVANEELAAQAEELFTQAEELRRANEEVDRQRLFSERLMQRVPVGIAYLDRDLIFRMANPTLVQRFDLTVEQVLGRNVYDMFPEMSAQLRPILEAELSTGNPFFFSAASAERDGRTTYWDTSHFPMRGPDGEVEGILVLSVEVSDRVERERAQEERVTYLEELDRYKDEFLSVISHELRTPLNFIMGFASILEEDSHIDPTHRAYVSRILEGADRMLTLVNDLLDVARINAGRFQLDREPAHYVDVVGRVLDTLKPLADDKALHVETAIDVPAPQVLDAPRITQVLTNLVGNAIKFTPQGGRIDVRAYVRDGELITEVQDTGVGIAPEHVAQIFERFVQVDMSATRQAGGTGLGLSISKSLVEAHGGRIGVESTPGRGSTFWFALPESAVEAAAPVKPLNSAS